MTNRRANFINMVDHLSDVPTSVIDQEMKFTNKSFYRQSYHIESESGSLGDPNGFSYFNNQYHLFYQWSPLAFSNTPHYTQHGWKHLVSQDLVHWQDLGAGIESDTKFDKYGTYSGSALPIDDQLFLMYTGNTWVNTQSLNDWHRIPYQLGAVMNKNNQINKWHKPLLIGPLKGYTGHFRDPKIFKKNGVYYAVLGIQRKNKTGTALLAKSRNLRQWSIIGEIKTKHEHFGYMWECPDYYELDGKGILEFCPQGLSAENNRFKNIYQNGYFIGSPLNLANVQFDCQEFQELDKGFDFYAMQTMEDKNHRRILMAWMGLPEIQYPTEKYHYTGCMIFPRELKIKDNHILQKPVNEIQGLYQKEFLINKKIKQQEEIKAGMNNARDIKLTLDCSKAYSFILDLFANKDNSQHLRLIFNHKKQEFIVNRGKCGISVAEDYGTERSCQINLDQPIKIRILQDTSSAEIFLNNGQDVFSMRVFPEKKSTYIFANSYNGTSLVSFDIHQLSK